MASTKLMYKLLITSSLVLFGQGKVKRPNIILIIADDLGWDDVSFHGSDQILTPNIDSLAASGVAFKRYYSHTTCTPSRAALLTGKYAYNLGMQGYPLTNGEERGLPLTEKLLPEYLKELGYATHLVGKWHLGHFKEAYLPTRRGFDTYFGHRGGFVDYYEYTSEELWSIGKVTGFDLYNNLSAAWDVQGYLTDVYTEKAKTIIADHNASTPLFLTLAHSAPHSGNDGALLQAPPEDVRAMRHIESPERRIYGAMVKKLDESVGDIVEALSQKKILENSVIVFISDNGGMTKGISINYASNWPLRGTKMTPFEGGLRVIGLLWTSEKKPTNHWDEYIHVADWLPTLLRAAGIEPPQGIDGVDQWDNIISNKQSKREEIFEIDDYNGFYTYINGEFKLITGTVDEEYSKHLAQDLRGTTGNTPNYKDAIKNSKVFKVMNNTEMDLDLKSIILRKEMRMNCRRNFTEDDLCYPNNGTLCMYNVRTDPCEINNISEGNPRIVENMLARLKMEISRRIPRRVPLYRDPRALPRLHNFTWSTWGDCYLQE